MTAVTAAPRAASKPRPTRWVLRLHRPALYVWAGLVLALAALLLALYGPLADAAAEGWRQYDACGWSERKCAYDQDAIIRYKDYYNYATIALGVLPFLVAAWAGAALVGTELESGTAHLAWTQGMSPARWLAVRLAVAAAAVTTGGTALVWLHHLAWTAGRGRIDTAKSWYDTWSFHANGPTTVAFALAGLAAGALAGLLLRRALPALVLGALATGAVQALAQTAMPHLWPAVTRVTSLKQGYAGVGIDLDEGIVTSTGAHAPVPSCPPEDALSGCHASYAKADAVGFFHTYHPGSHYWPLQWTTTALLLTVTGLLVLGSFLMLRRLTGTLKGASA
ncbi:ABC transporter permease [Streptomyces diastatochromogenes]|uniref:ABC transporter permease n=1 Tax=Streptomyces diastatochromogenes TaxID=42236 RepID=UPI0036CD0AF0